MKNMSKLLVAIILLSIALNGSDNTTAQQLDTSSNALNKTGTNNPLYINAGKSIKRKLTKEDRKNLQLGKEVLDIENIVIIKNKIYPDK